MTVKPGHDPIDHSRYEPLLLTTKEQFDRYWPHTKKLVDRCLRRATYGEGDAATTVVVNFGEIDASVTTELGGKVCLPPWGVAIEGPRFAAFYAKQWGGRSYPDGALFTLRVVEGKSLEDAGQLRVFHGFGDPVLTWKGADYEVVREEVITPTE